MGGRCLHLEGGKASLTRDPPLVTPPCWVPFPLSPPPRTSASSLLLAPRPLLSSPPRPSPLSSPPHHLEGPRLFPHGCPSAPIQHATTAHAAARLGRRGHRRRRHGRRAVRNQQETHGRSAVRGNYRKAHGRARGVVEKNCSTRGTDQQRTRKRRGGGSSSKLRILVSVDVAVCTERRLARVRD